VNALLGDTPRLVEYGSALMANLATKEVKAVVCILLICFASCFCYGVYRCVVCPPVPPLSSFKWETGGFNLPLRILLFSGIVLRCFEETPTLVAFSLSSSCSA
jgi:hypothetical protein